MKKRWIGRPLLASLCGLLFSLSGVANPIIQKIERATPVYRIIHLLNYFDTCQAVTQHPAYAFQVLRTIDQVGLRMHDDQLRRYCQFLKDTHAKHGDLTQTQKAELFLKVGRKAADNHNPQIAAVCEHFAGQYYYLNEEYGKAFEHLLAANRAFRRIGYRNIPEIHRYLYELAFDYYHFHEREKVIALLREAVRYPPFSGNLAIQTYNTLALTYARLDRTDRAASTEQAKRYYRKAQQVADFYRDSVWIGITAGNLGELYAREQQWPAALAAYQTDYRFGMKFGENRYIPSNAALNIADVFWHLGQLDSCRHYLDRFKQLYLANLTIPDFARSLDDENYMKRYYEIGRRYYQSANNHALSDRYADSLLVLTNRINERFNTRQISLVEQKLLIQRHQSEVSAIEAEKSSQRTLFWLTGAVLALLAGLFGRLYYLGRIRRRQEQAIEAEKEKTLRLEKQIVEDELQQAQVDLNGFVENLNQKKSLIDALTTQLEKLEPNNSVMDETQLNEARQRLRHSNLLTKDDWDEFQRRFERVHPGFFWQLRTQFSDISPAEERLLALSQLRLDTSQMGRMLGISPSSIHKTKYRLRKKLGISADSPLSELLDHPADSTITH